MQRKANYTHVYNSPRFHLTPLAGYEKITTDVKRAGEYVSHPGENRMRTQARLI